MTPGHKFLDVLLQKLGSCFEDNKRASLHENAYFNIHKMTTAHFLGGKCLEYSKLWRNYEVSMLIMQKYY